MDPDPIFGILLYIGLLEISLFVLLVILIVFSGLISGSETAFFSLSPEQLDTLKSDHSKKAKKIIDLHSNPSRLLATILVANNIINVGIIIVSNNLVKKFLKGSNFNPIDFHFFDWDFTIRVSQIEFLITVVLVTFILVLFGEVSPKIYANTYNIQLSTLMARPLNFLQKLFHPLTKYLITTTDFFQERLSSSNVVSKEEINKAIELIVNDETASEQEIDILNSLVKFSELSAKQVMQARVNVVAVQFSDPFSKILNLVRREGYSRYPVYAKDLDNITGVLHVKDLIDKIGESDDFEWQTYIRPPMYVPEYKKIEDILTRFQLEKVHMAIVVDEYGGTQGLITFEDIIEEIIGEINDEFDDDDIEYEKLDDNTYVFEGKTLLNDVFRIMKLDDEEFDDLRGDADSVAGLMLEVLGRIPRKNDSFIYKKHSFKVIDVDKRRIKKIQLVKPV